jgi:hypothetical protein
MAGGDYGPKGCCGPSAYAALIGLVLLPITVVRTVRKRKAKR